MKTNRFTNLIAAAFGLAAFSTAGCTAKEKSTEAPVPPAKDTAAATVTTTMPGPTTPRPTMTDLVAATANPEAAAKWSDLKDYTYDQRAQFFAGLSRLEARVDEQVDELTVKRGAMKSTTDTQGWDFAMKEMQDARSALHSIGTELSQATSATWDQEKDKVGQAWVRTQEAYDKVKSSTTS
jgi:hypothetical protein